MFFLIPHRALQVAARHVETHRIGIDEIERALRRDVASAFGERGVVAADAINAAHRELLVAGAAAPQAAQAQPGVPFTVAQTMIPIAGTGQPSAAADCNI